MQVCLGGLTLGRESLHLLTNRIVKPRVRDDCIPVHARIDHSAACLNQITTYLPTVTRPLFIKISRCLLCVRVSECACVQHVRVYRICMHLRMCAHTFRVAVFVCCFGFLILLAPGDSYCSNLFINQLLFFPP